CCFSRSSRNLHRFEVVLLADPAVGAAPVVGDVIPAGASRKPFAWSTFRLVVDIVADRAAVPAHSALSSSRKRLIGAVSFSRKRLIGAAPYLAISFSRLGGGRWALVVS